jgi:hypothetical protein
MSGDGLVVPGSTLASGRCALCEFAFLIGDQITTVWPARRRVGEISPALVVHRACFQQLDAGDLARIYTGLRQLLAGPLSVVRRGLLAERSPN